MPSREVRRVINKKDKKETDSNNNPMEDLRFKGRPLFFAFSVIVLGFIVVTFIAMPVVSRWAYGQRFIFGSYAGKDIAFIPGYDNYFNNQYQYWAQQLSQYNFGQDNVKQQIEYAFRYAFENTVQHFAMLHEAEKSGVHVSQSAIDESLLQYGPYVVGGTFSQERYDQTTKMNRNAIAVTRGEELLAQKYAADMTENAFKDASKSEQDFILGSLGKERQFAIVNYDFNSYPADEVKKYAEANMEKFNKIQLSRIIINSNKNEAESIRQMAVAGERSFDDLARSFSKDELYAEKGGDMGSQNFYDLKLLLESDDAVRQVFKVAKGGYSDIVEVKNTLSGEKSWIFFRINSDVTVPDLTKEETITTVKNYLLSNEKSVMDTYFMEKAKEFKKLAGEKGFAEAAKALNLAAPKETEFFPINYNNIFDSKSIKLKGSDDTLNIGSLASNEDILTTLFSLKEGQITEPFVQNNQILVIKLLGERTMSTDDQKAVTDKINEWRQQASQGDVTRQVVDEKEKHDLFATAFERFFGWRFNSTQDNTPVDYAD